MVNKTILENVKDVIATGLGVVESAKSDIIWLLPPQMLVFAGQFGLTKKIAGADTKRRTRTGNH